MPEQEFGFHDLLINLHEGRVMAAAQAEQLGSRNMSRRADGRAGKR